MLDFYSDVFVEQINKCLDLVSKPHLMPECCFVSRLKILTYYRVCSVFKSAYALPSNMI